MTSLYLELCANGHQIATAGGFVVQHCERNFLVTNWHVLTGRHAETGEPLDRKTAALPDEVRIALPLNKPGPATWEVFREPLNRKDGTPRWVEHPRGCEVDVACLELTIAERVQLFALDIELAKGEITVVPGMSVQIIGFPLGIRPAEVFFAIWKTGHVASDPDIEYGDKPAFLIDATTREGMSGSPVVARGEGDYWAQQRIFHPGSVVTKFLGIYSGRIHEQAEIGIVWTPDAIIEVLDRATTGTPDAGRSG